MRAWPLPTLFEGVFCIFAGERSVNLPSKVSDRPSLCKPHPPFGAHVRIGSDRVSDSAKAARAVMEMVVKNVSFTALGAAKLMLMPACLRPGVASLSNCLTGCKITAQVDA